MMENVDRHANPWNNLEGLRQSGRAKGLKRPSLPVQPDWFWFCDNMLTQTWCWFKVFVQLN